MKANRTAWLLGFARVLAPFYVLMAGYLVFHRLCVRDVYVWLPKGYAIHGPIAATQAIFHAMTFWLTPFLDAVASLVQPEEILPPLMLWRDAHPYWLPTALVVITIAIRNRRMAFGILWAVLAFLPANCIPDYHTPRYYYGAITGIAIVYAEFLLALDRTIAARQRMAEIVTARLVGSILILAFVYSGMIYTTVLVNNDTRKCGEIEELYHFLVLQRGRVPPNTLFRVWCLNQQDHFHEGAGLREMFKLALDQDSVEAILPDQNLTDQVRALLLKNYSRPVEVFREPSGHFRLVTAVATTATLSRAK